MALPCSAGLAQISSPPVSRQIAQRQAQVTGTVTYLQRIALPPNAVVEVTLQEVSRLDAAAVTVADQKIPAAGQQVPIPFTLSYDAGQINPRYTYVVRAKITVEGQMRWTSSTAYRVITQGNPSTVEIQVEPVQASSQPVNPPANPSTSSAVSSARYDCAAQIKSYPAAQNVSLGEAQRLRLQRNGNQFVYRCALTTAEVEQFRYRCQSQVSGYTDRESVALAEAETLMVQMQDSQFVYQCSPTGRNR
jgi:uncharacterized lipoprotein YbaY